MSSDLCACGRPKFTPVDLERWNRENAADARPLYFNPDWAKAICWMISTPCPMVPLTKEPTQ